VNDLQDAGGGLESVDVDDGAHVELLVVDV
jgi:hypothetical protein